MPTKSKGAVIRQLREEQGISCTQLAARASLDVTLLWKIENGKLDGSPKTRLAIAEALGVPLTTITYFKPLPERTKAAA